VHDIDRLQVYKRLPLSSLASHSQDEERSFRMREFSLGSSCLGDRPSIPS
jgi:hypothetical protein